MICTLALILLIDVSGSINETRYQQQLQGYAAALNDPQIHQLVESQPHAVAVSVVEFSQTSETVIPWTVLHSSQDIEIFSSRLSAVNRSSRGVTLIDQAINASVDQFNNVPCTPQRRVIDISGDGSDSFSVTRVNSARDRAQLSNITINGLPIVTSQEPDIASYYESNVVTEDGFVIIADSFDDIFRAVRRKLIFEIANR